MAGRIIKGIAGFYYVHIKGQGIYECKAKGIFRKEGMKPLVGDKVDIEILSEEDKEGNITNIYERKNSLIRPAVSNVDQALIIFSAKNPKPNFNLLDRFLVMMEYQNVPVVICFNKVDLCEEDYIRELEDIYKETGYSIINTSAKTRDGHNELIEILSGKTSTVAGPSGAGKSSLINTLQSNILMETGEISKKLGRGRHTTRHCELIMLDIEEPSYIVDTPGFSTMDIPGFTKDDLKECYPEFLRVSSKCRFSGCAHINEPDCEVKSLVEEGKLSKIRYDNYVKLYEELDKRQKY